MSWLKILIGMGIVLSSALGGAALSFTLRVKSKPAGGFGSFLAVLPGFDCGICGYKDCASYSSALVLQETDPGLCSPGGHIVEAALRRAISGRRGDLRAIQMHAVVKCCGGHAENRTEFRSAEEIDCDTAALFYLGPRSCKNGCLGLGSCVRACPLGAISIFKGVARVNSSLCSGCGICLTACPKRLIALQPADQNWFVACNSRITRMEKEMMCSVACVACNECVHRSFNGEFSLSESLAKANHVSSGKYEEISEKCPTGVIRRVFTGKKER